MTDYTNNYFHMMNDIGTGYEAARVIRKAEKDALMRADDWDGVKVWNQREEKEFPFPFSRGQMSAYRAWQNSTAKESSLGGESILEVNDLPWAKDAHDFVETLKEAGITQFAITDRSTALMELLHVLTDEEGCRMISLCKVIRSEKRWGEEGTEEYEGILMSL